MGFRVTLAAVTGATPAAIHAALGLTATGRHETCPESPICGRQPSAGRYWLFINDDDLATDLDRFARLSADLSANPSANLTTNPSAIPAAPATVTVCVVNETVMASHAFGFAGGREVWSVEHDCNQGVDHLASAGVLPAEFAAIAARLRAALAAEPPAKRHPRRLEDFGVDHLFDVAVDLFVASGGFHYGKIEGEWEILDPPPTPPKRRWWPFG
jgi:hypothetical protein